MTSIVLVPGAGLGGWAWSRVCPLLRARGHDPHPITLTGTGDRAHLNRPGLDLSAWVTDVVAHLETEELTDVVLVGHSFCATVASGVAQRVPERVRRLVYLDAPYVLRDGQSAFDAMAPEQAELLTAVAEAHDGWSLPWFTDEQLDRFYAGHGLTPDDRRWLRRHVTAQPLATYRQALRLDRVSAPATFIHCTDSPVPRPTTADGAERIELDAGHWPMITAPTAVAEQLARVADAVGA